MKALSRSFLVAAAGLALAACGTAPRNPGTPIPPGRYPSALLIADGLEARGLPITRFIRYSGTYDPEHALGRPGRYVSKVDFIDARRTSGNGGVQSGGSVEVYASSGDAQAREASLARRARRQPIRAEHDYRLGQVLLRLAVSLTAKQVAVYERALRDIVRSGAAR